MEREEESGEERENEGMEAATEEASTIGQFWLGGMPCSNRDDFLAWRERVRAGWSNCHFQGTLGWGGRKKAALDGSQ